MKRQQEFKEPEPKKVASSGQERRFVHNVLVQQNLSVPFMYMLSNGAAVNQGDGAFRGCTGSWFSYFKLPQDQIPSSFGPFDLLEELWDLKHDDFFIYSQREPPILVNHLFQWVNRTIYRTGFQHPFNQCALICFDDGNDYLKPSSFDESFLERNAAGETAVIMIFFGAKRKFRLLAKDQKNPNHIDYEIDLVNNSVVVMGGTCQRTHFHTIPHQLNEPGQQLISLTFRILVQK